MYPKGLLWRDCLTFVCLFIYLLSVCDGVYEILCLLEIVCVSVCVCV